MVFLTSNTDSRRTPVRGSRARAGRRAFTLAESLIASVVLALAVVGVATTIAASHQQASQVETNATLVAMARQLIEEIAAKPLVATDATPGWPGQQDRGVYDTVNDYDGYTDASPIQTLEGPKMSIGTVAFTRTVKLKYPTSLFGTTVSAGDFAIVEVSVQDARGNQCVLRRLVTKTNLKR